MRDRIQSLIVDHHKRYLKKKKKEINYCNTKSWLGVYTLAMFVWLDLILGCLISSLSNIILCCI